MRDYEAIIILKSNLTDEKIEMLVSRFEKKVNDNGGEFLKADKIGQKRIPFRLQKHKSDKDGIYMILKFKGEGKAAFALREDFRVQEDILRHMIARIPEEQKVIVEELESAQPAEIKEEISGQPQ